MHVQCYTQKLHIVKVQEKNGMYHETGNVKELQVSLKHFLSREHMTIAT